MKDFLKKLTSRKFLMALGVVAVGVALAFGIDASTIERLVGAVMGLVGAVTYIITEGIKDVKSATQVIETVEDNLETLKEVHEEIKNEFKEGE